MSKGRKLLKIHFDFDKCHLAYTSEDYSACSLKDDAVLFKSMNKAKKPELSETQKKLLEKVKKGKQVSKPVEKSSGTENPSASVEEVSEVKSQNLNKDKGSDKDMSKPTEKEAFLEKQLNLMKGNFLKSELEKFSFSEETIESLSGVLLTVEDSTPIFKAMKELVASTEESITKSLKDSVDASNTNIPDNNLTEALNKEKGSVVPEDDLNKSDPDEKKQFQENIAKAMKQISVQ